ncbi:MAG: helix-turn-helix transcriptional regulator [Planctomycetia bacterium]|jgi:DNA-binding XRE family transcriptional regulator|nr:helix-turn-helix transcriptional regulator [Planctomycetia bacterium]
MRSALLNRTPQRVLRSLQKMGGDIAVARRKRHVTIAMMAERIGVAQSTYARIEKGDPKVAIGAYAMALFVLGLGEVLGDVADVRRDDQGLLLDAERLPKRVRVKKSPTPS